MSEFVRVGQSAVFASSTQFGWMPRHRRFDENFTDGNWWCRATLPTAIGAGQSEHWLYFGFGRFPVLTFLVSTIHSYTMHINWPNGVCHICASITISSAKYRRKAWKRCIRTIKSICERIDGHRSGISKISITINAAWTRWIESANKEDESAQMKMGTTVYASLVVSSNDKHHSSFENESHSDSFGEIIAPEHTFS